jgi:hypothetical protein
MKVDSKAVTAQRVAWELAHGQLPPGTEVRGCPLQLGHKVHGRPAARHLNRQRDMLMRNQPPVI